MKETELKIRLSKEFKSKFKNKCERENITMSNKLYNLINNYIDDGIVIEHYKSIRIILVKTILSKILNLLLFENIDSAKGIIESEFQNNLIFETKLNLKIDNENNICYGDVFFQLEDKTYYSITFNIISNTHVL
jgi:hypothetical protein